MTGMDKVCQSLRRYTAPSIFLSYRGGSLIAFFVYRINGQVVVTVLAVFYPSRQIFQPFTDRRSL